MAVQFLRQCRKPVACTKSTMHRCRMHRLRRARIKSSHSIWGQVSFIRSSSPDVPEGFSLLETMVSLAIASLVLLTCSMTAIAVLRGAGRVSQVAEDWEVLGSVRRVILEDAHAASSASAFGGSLVLREMSGAIYTYYLNPNCQLVRVKAGGGTAVIATDVRVFSTSQRSASTGWLLTISVQTMDGQSLSWDVGNGG